MSAAPRDAAPRNATARDIVLELDELSVRYRAEGGYVLAVAGVSLRVERGTCYGLVGESGCGKSTVALATMRHLGPRGAVSSGAVRFRGRDLGGMSWRELRALRGSRMAMIYQDAASALNPTMTIGAQLTEVLAVHGGAADAAEHRARAARMLSAVGLPDPDGTMRRYPHQLSGGQKQRAVIAMAFLVEPDLLILDEPTTALDVTVEAEIMDLLADLQARRGTAMLFVSHNLGLIRRVSDRVGVMYAGQIVEEGPTARIIRAPRHPYTRGLVACAPRLDAGRANYSLQSIPGQVRRLRAPPEHCAFVDRCPHAAPGLCNASLPPSEAAGDDGARVRCHRWRELGPAAGPLPPSDAPVADPETEILRLEGISKTYRIPPRLGSFGGVTEIAANRDVDLVLHRGEVLGLVGESGCGKSTLAQIVMGLERPSAGRLTLLGEDVTGRTVGRRTSEQIRNCQMVFQNPDRTLNPSHSVGFILDRAVRRLGAAMTRSARRAEVLRLMERVRLPEETLGMAAGQLSGGQRQRVAVARAFAGDPALVIADEPTSALDTSVKTAILELLLEARRDTRTALIFISHDLGVVRYIADRVAVMYMGRIVESGPADAVFSPPYHPYTEVLLSTVPLVDTAVAQRQLRMQGEMQAPSAGLDGCAFADRCPRRLGSGQCARETPPTRRAETGHALRCHLPLDALRAVPPVFHRAPHRPPSGPAMSGP